MTIGYTADYTVGVWVGNFDNSPMREISGVTGAGPIFHDIMIRLYRNHIHGYFYAPPKILSQAVCSFSGTLPHQGCKNLTDEYFVEGTEPKNLCSFHLNNGAINASALMPEYSKWLEGASDDRIADQGNMAANSEFGQKLLKIIHPRDNAVFKIDPNVKLSYQSVYFEALAPVQINELNWYLTTGFTNHLVIPSKCSGICRLAFTDCERRERREIKFLGMSPYRSSAVSVKKRPSIPSH